MTRMSSSPSSRIGVLATLAVAVALLTSVAVPVAAVSTSAEGVPEDPAVGDEVSATFTLTELYTDYESWTLNGRTELTEVTWTVTKFDQAGNQISKTSYDGQSFNDSVDIGEDTSEVQVTVTGTVPEIGNFTYDPQQSFEVTTLNLVREGGTTDEIDAWTATHHTADSQEAREAIANAESAIDEAEAAGANTDTAEQSLQSAIDAYNNENFDNAVSLGERAQDEAETAQQNRQSSQQTQQLLMYGVAGLVLLGLIGGGFYWYSQQQEDTSKLR